MDYNKEKILIIVDGYSSGAQIPKAMAEFKWKCVHVQSSENLNSYYYDSFRHQDYIATFTYKDSFVEMAEQLMVFKPRAILPGTETGVFVADMLAHVMNLPGNNPDTTLARRNKYVMHQYLKKANLRSMDDFLAHDVIYLLKWANKGDWPIVLKPQDSAGTDSVHFCDNEQMLQDVFKSIHGKTNQLGSKNNVVLAQRKLIGTEYFINGITVNGDHTITEIWQAKKVISINNNWIYDCAKLFDPFTPEMQPFVTYVQNVLDALGVTYGASHTELIDTENGLTLIECASRLSGGLDRTAINYAVGSSQLDLTSKMVADYNGLLTTLKKMQQKGHRHPLWQVQLISHQTGVLKTSFHTQLFQELKSKIWIQRIPQVGDKFTKTVDSFSSPGIIYLSHPSSEVMTEDYNKIRQWESDLKMFSVE